MTTPLTRHQLAVAVAIRDFRHRHGYAPTMQELADQFGVEKATIFDHVRALEAKGVLRRDPSGKARSLEIIAAKLLPKRGRLRFKVLGSVDGRGVHWGQS